MNLDQIRKKVVEVNAKFATLASLTHDELRERYAKLRTQSLDKVKSGVPAQEVQDAALAEVFALFKEVARRFATNEELEVERTNLDAALYKNYDFIQDKKWRKDHKARIPSRRLAYTTSWLVCGERYKWGVIPYDEQLMGGIAIHEGKVIEMYTGEGKTFVAIAPVLLNALVGKSVHIMTSNNYLSRRDFEITRPLYSFFGLTVGCIEDKNVRGRIRKKAYQADVVLGTTSTFVFDYLYDMMRDDLKGRVQNNYDFAILDEADSVLIDEASTPHVITNSKWGNVQENKTYIKYLPIVKELIAANHKDNLFVNSKIKHTAEYTREGEKWLRDKLQFDQLFNTPSLETKKSKILSCTHLTKEQKEGQLEDAINQYGYCKGLENVLNKLLLALTVYEKDVDYVVISQTKKDKTTKAVQIVDENTGRLKESHRWEYGLHEAIEAKEGISAFGLDARDAVISIKNYLKKYNKIGGMTGTAVSCAEELKSVYGLMVQRIPTHRPAIRENLPLRVFSNQELLDDAVIALATDLQRTGRPVLVCTSTIKRSEVLAKKFRDKAVEIQVLNGKTLWEEARLITNAGKHGCITVSTSVAGRGTDIILDEEAKANGGLAVIGVGIADSIRIDQQLAGRSGRQGNPGSSQFLVSLQDDILEYLDPDDKEIIRHYATTTTTKEVTSNHLCELFVKAQRNCMERSCEQRVKANLRDDAIDAFRNRMYTYKSELLGDVNIANDILQKMDGSNSLEGEFDGRVDTLYKTALSLLRKIKENTYITREYERFPLSDGTIAFSIPFDLDAALETKGKSFCSEIKRYLLVAFINECWHQFINEINNECIDPKDFADIFNKRKKQMLDELKYKLTKLVIPVQEIDIAKKKRKAISQEPILRYFSQHLLTVGMTDPCPCGSGLLYYNCHGATKFKS